MQMYKIVDKFVKMNQIYKTLFYVTSFTINISFYVILEDFYNHFISKQF